MIGLTLSANIRWSELQELRAKGDAAATVALEMLDHMADCGFAERLPDAEAQASRIADSVIIVAPDASDGGAAEFYASINEH